MTRSSRLALMVICSFTSLAAMKGCRGAGGSAETVAQRHGPSRHVNVQISRGKFLRSVWADSSGGLSSGPPSGKLVTLVLFPEDLGCIPCMLNFLEFCDSLRMCLALAAGNHAMLLVKRGQGTYADQRRKISAWMKAGRIGFPAWFVEPESLQTHNLVYTSVVVVDSLGDEEMHDVFPLPAATRSTILDTLLFR